MASAKNFLAERFADMRALSLGYTSAKDMQATLGSIDGGPFVSTGDTARDAQILGNSAIQRTYRDASAAGINPTAFLLGQGTSQGATSAATIGSQGDREQRKINQQFADAQTLTSKANMINALSNSAKAISSLRTSFGGSKSFASVITRRL